ncbi:MAG TPA: hydantoinase/oxoprolinase family protein, partial [Vitreimonas sp.]|nr:hydantoinase/oxoprolinase family protein [Vitreimonas sp.]
MIDVRPSGPDDASPALRIGVDTGGTFTDCVLWDPSTGGMTVAKVPSQPLRPEAAVAEGLAELTRVAAIEPSAVGFVGHGTTIATNALITGEVAAVGLLTNRGFRDVLEIGTQQRPLLYPLHQRPRTFLVPRDRRMGIRGRIGPLGNVLEELDEAEVADAARSLAGLGVDAIAIAMLFSFANPAQERRVEAIVREVVPGIHVARSSEVSSELREYPRFTTTAVNAALAPLLDRYIGAVDRSLRDTGYGAPLHVIQSNGGVATAERSIHANAHRLVLSGPAAGVIGGSHVASAAGFDDVVTLDIGGTSADVGVVVGGRPRMATG